MNGPTKWKAHVCADSPLREDIITKQVVQDLVGPYTPTSPIVFKSLFKVKDITNLTLRLVMDCKLKLTVYDNDKEILVLTGNGVVVIPSLLLLPDKNRKYIIQASVLTPPNKNEYSLRVIGEANIARDTTREDKLKLLKESWESQSPGRLLKSRETRELYKGSFEWSTNKNECVVVQVVRSDMGVSTAESRRARRGSTNPNYEFGAVSTTVVKSTDKFTFLGPDDLEALSKSRAALAKATAEYQAEVVKTRLIEKEKRLEDKKRVMEIIEQKVKEVESFHAIDLERRNAVNAKIEEEAAKLRAIEEAKNFQILEEVSVATSAASKAKKRK
jgi:hypothetical protein